MKRKRKDQKIEKIAFTLSSGPNKHKTREVLKNRSKSFVGKTKDENNNLGIIIPHKNKNEEMVRKYNKTGKYSKKNKYKEWKDDDDDDGGGDLSDLSFDDDYEDDGSNARKHKRTAVVDESS